MKDITPKLMQKYFESGKLGNIRIEIPDQNNIYKEMDVDLSELYRHSTGIKFFKFEVSPEEIQTMCVYGSVLYKHFSLEEKIPITRKKYWLFGPTQTTIRTKSKPIHFPNDFDIMIITNKAFSKEKIIKPKKHIVDDSYGPYEVIDHTSIKTKKRLPSSYGYFEILGGANLHIVYRSVEQFLKGLGKGDTLSESVVRYGIPIVGQEKFYKIIDEVNYPKREAKHFIKWTEDLEGKLQGEIF